MHRLLIKEYNLAVTAIENLRPRTSKVSIAVDGWTSPNKMAILSIIGYFVTDDWHLAEIQLGFQQIRGQHSGSNMASTIIDILTRYGISDGRFQGITTDNCGSNFTMSEEIEKTLRIMGREWSSANNHVRCMAHVIQLSLGAFMSKLKIRGRESWYEEAQRDQLGENDPKGKV
jgi:hypothetical protein